MKTIALFLWHSFHAWRYNRIAAAHAVTMRSGATPEIRSDASQRLLSEGATSNMHERERDWHRGLIQRRPLRYGGQVVAAVMIAVAIGIFLL